MSQIIRRNLAPNRLAVYFTALAALAVGVASVVGDLDFQSTAGALGSVAILAGVVAKWLGGWHQYEQALYQRELLHTEHAAVMEQHAARVEAAQAVSRPGTRKPGPILPR